MHGARVTRLVLLRHGETDYNATGRMQGQLDASLTERGRRQSEAVAEVLSRRCPLLVVSSDLQRARDTGVAIARRAGVPFELDRRLREMHLGAWQDRTAAEIDVESPGERADWLCDPTWRGHGGESRRQAGRRAEAVVSDLLATRPDWGAVGSARPVVLTAHSAVLRALVARLLGLPLHLWQAVNGLGNGSWGELSGHTDPWSSSVRWRMDVWNASGEHPGVVV